MSRHRSFGQAATCLSSARTTVLRAWPSCTAKPASGPRVQPLDVDFDALDRFEEMRAAFEAVGQPLWAAATVAVDAAGTPKARFTYAD